MATRVARYLLDEASTGTTPTTCADDTGNGNTLTIDYSSGDLQWTSITEGNGLDFLAASVTNATAVCILNDVATNGSVGAALDGATQVWFAMSIGNIAGHSSGARLFAVGTDSGNTDVSVIKEESDIWHVRWDMETGGDNFQSEQIFHTAKAHETLIVQIDTTQASRADALQFYIDGSAITAQFTTSYVQNAALGNVNSTDRNLTLGNRGDTNRNVQGQIYYAEMGTGVLTAQEVSDLHTNLIADNDSDPLASGGADHALDATDIESATQVSSPSITQAHDLAPVDAESTTSVSSPSLAQVHSLSATSVESASSTSAPSLSEAHQLSATDVESASSITSPAITQAHSLTANDTESTSSTDSPALAQNHSLTGTDTQATSEVSAPSLSSGVDHALSAVSVESASSVTTPTLSQSHSLQSLNVSSVTDLSTPTLQQVHDLTGQPIESSTSVSAPNLVDGGVSVEYLTYNGVTISLELSLSGVNLLPELSAWARISPALDASKIDIKPD